MGGVAIVGGAFAGYVVSNLYRGIYTRTGLVVMAAIVGAGTVGFLDDWIKVRRARNLGLTKRTKLAGQLAVAIAFVVAIERYAQVDTHLSFTRAIPAIDLGPWLWGVAAVFLFIGSTNAVNLTDGLDGLAAGSVRARLRRLHDHRLLAVPSRRSTTSPMPSTSRSSRSR